MTKKDRGGEWGEQCREEKEDCVRSREERAKRKGVTVDY